VTLVSDDGQSADEDILPSSSYTTHNYNDGKDYMRYSWVKRTTGATMVLSDSASPLSSYAVIYAGDTVCRASRAVCGPVEGTSSNFIKGDTSLWTLRVDGKQYTPKSSNWTIKMPNDLTITSSDSTMKIPLTSLGTISASLKASDGKKSRTFTCSDLVVRPNVSGCACNCPILKSDNFNVADYVPVYGWYVDGCESDGEKLTYEWFGYYNSEFSLYNNDSAGWAYFYNVGPYAPTVKVSNTYGASQDLTCPEAEAVYLRCWTDSISVQMGDTVKWYYSLDGSIKNPTFYWEFREDDGDTITSTDEFPKWVYSDLKTIYTSLTLNHGLPDEVTVNCGWVSPRPRPVTGCTCGEPELLSESYNFEENVVKYRWHVTGCDANGATPLKYTWDDYFVPLESDSTVVEYSYTQYYSLSPFVTITNADGMIQNMYCESAKLMQASCKPDRDTAEVGESVVWNWTFNTSVDFGGIKTFLWTFTNGDGVVSTSSNGTHMEQHQVVGNVSATLELNKNLVDDYLINCSPLYVKPKVKRTCACEYDVSPGKGQGSIVSWTVSDCGGTAPYTYEWSNDVTPDPENPETASATFPEPGTYWPTVAVTDANGMELSVVCPKVNVEISGED
jgi:plastocyanin